MPDDSKTPFDEELREIFRKATQGGSDIPVRLLLKDLRAAAITLSDRQARYLVDDYYIIQDDRKRCSSQADALKKAGEPADLIDWLMAQDRRLESFVQPFLAIYLAQHKMGAWMSAVYGIGPVLGAGLLAYLDINKAPTVGHIWQFCGIAGAGQKVWGKGEKRPWSAQAKVLCWKIGDSFIKFSNREECYYGHIYRNRKADEITNNDSGKLAQQAAAEAIKKSRTTTAWPWNAACYPPGTCSAAMKLEQDKRDAFLKTVKGVAGSGLPMLHPGHINDRARRYAVKQFLADLHGEWYRTEFGREPPLPYPIAHLGHAHLRAAE